MQFRVIKSFEGDLGNGPQTVAEGLELELEPVGEVKYWLAMGWVEPVKAKPESATLEAPEKAVLARPDAKQPRAQAKKK